MSEKLVEETAEAAYSAWLEDALIGDPWVALPLALRRRWIKVGAAACAVAESINDDMQDAIQEAMPSAYDIAQDVVDELKRRESKP